MRLPPFLSRPRIRVVAWVGAFGLMLAWCSTVQAAVAGADPAGPWGQKFTDAFFAKFRDPWVFFGFAAQGCFMMRFVWQWLASERRGESHIPVIFWYFSLGGGTMLFVYAVHIIDPVIMLGQALGILIYLRNLRLIYKSKKRNGRPGFPVSETEASSVASAADSTCDSTPRAKNHQPAA